MSQTKLSDLFDRALFDAMIDGGYVRVQHHPTLDLHIANYSEKAQYERVWNDVTLTCRGLIYNSDGDIIARPYRKFFNYGDEENTGPLDLNAPVVVTDKLDGSLGIGYPTPDGPAIATRGSFTSDQALHATALLRERYPNWRLPGCTPMFEIVYPDNRIVVDYGDQDDLILHGFVSFHDGYVYNINGVSRSEWPGPRVTSFAYRTLAEALAAEPRPNAEGLVVQFRDGRMVKVKQEDYVALHRIISGLNARTVWEWLGDGKTVGDLCATLPDEFHGWVEAVANELTTAQQEILMAANCAYSTIEAQGFADRRQFAAMAKGFPESMPYLFLLLDGHTERGAAAAWREVKPSGARSMVNHSEAVA